MIDLLNKYDRLLTFKTVHHFIKIEKIIKNKNFVFDSMPVPQKINVNCGLCLLFLKKNEKV